MSGGRSDKDGRVSWLHPAHRRIPCNPAQRGGQPLRFLPRWQLGPDIVADIERLDDGANWSGRTPAYRCRTARAPRFTGRGGCVMIGRSSIGRRNRPCEPPLPPEYCRRTASGIHAGRRRRATRSCPLIQHSSSFATEKDSCCIYPVEGGAPTVVAGAAAARAAVGVEPGRRIHLGAQPRTHGPRRSFDIELKSGRRSALAGSSIL